MLYRRIGFISPRPIGCSLGLTGTDPYERRAGYPSKQQPKLNQSQRSFQSIQETMDCCYIVILPRVSLKVIPWLSLFSRYVSAVVLSKRVQVEYKQQKQNPKQVFVY